MQVDKTEYLLSSPANTSRLLNAINNIENYKEKALFFAVKIPNKETIQAIKEFENGETEKVTLAELEEEAKRCLR